MSTPHDLYLKVVEAYVVLGEAEGIRRQRQVVEFLTLMLETKEKMIREQEGKS